jgi:hypothetical protein
MAPAQRRERIMKITLIGLALVVLAGAAFAANLVVHAPRFDDGIDPLKPIAVILAID